MGGGAYAPPPPAGGGKSRGPAGRGLKKMFSIISGNIPLDTRFNGEPKKKITPVLLD